MDVIAALKACNVMRNLSERSYQRLAEGVQVRTYHDGDTVFEEGATFDLGLYIVAIGEVLISTELTQGLSAADENQADFFLTSMMPGDTFGEISVIDGGPRTARAEIRGESSLIFIPSQFIHLLSESDSRSGYIIMKNIGMLVAKRLREMDYAIKNKAFMG